MKNDEQNLEENYRAMIVPQTIVGFLNRGTGKALRNRILNYKGAKGRVFLVQANNYNRVMVDIKDLGSLCYPSIKIITSEKDFIQANLKNYKKSRSSKEKERLEKIILVSPSKWGNLGKIFRNIHRKYTIYLLDHSMHAYDYMHKLIKLDAQGRIVN